MRQPVTKASQELLRPLAPLPLALLITGLPLLCSMPDSTTPAKVYHYTATLQTCELIPVLYILKFSLQTFAMDTPTCIGCGQPYKTQKQLSKHASQCQQNHTLLQSMYAPIHFLT
ncbi:hypothetical protein BDR03DRAFT_1013682 [Suillus americanus]|nr:hypothetical protein BDR03DRAFT_1013682 [Suillus americanus]